MQFLRRHDEPVTTSSGEVRAGTDGGRTRAMFKKLPGVGNRMALHWWQKGLRCCCSGPLHSLALGINHQLVPTCMPVAFEHMVNLRLKSTVCTLFV